MKFVFGDNEINEVADGDFFTDFMQADYKECYLFIRFYSDADGTLVTPSAGTVTFTGAPDRAEQVNPVYLSIQSGSFAASTAHDVARATPYAVGPMTKAKLNLAGVTGATHFTAWTERYR